MNRSGSTGVACYGGLTMDVITRVSRLGAAGEVLAASEVRLQPGGSGVRQAIAAARAGATTQMLGRVGTDSFGAELRAGLDRDRIGTDGVINTVQVPTGTRHAAVADAGERSMIIHSGANSAQDGPTELQDEIIRGCGVLLLQLEIPMPAVLAAARLARRHGLRVILTPTPVQVIPSELLASIDVLVANESQALALVPRAGTAEEAVRDLVGRVPTVVVTLGSRGTCWASRSSAPCLTPAAPVFGPEIDAVVTGDTYVGYLAAGLVHGRDLRNAIDLASAAAGECATPPGSTESIPLLEQVLYRQAERNRHPGLGQDELAQRRLRTLHSV